MARITKISQILAIPLLIILVVYQKTLSPDHGLFRGLFPYGYCKFHPSCSEYARIVLLRQGIMGLPKIIKRILNCRPGVKPAIDLP